MATLVIQPDPTTGVDTVIDNNSPTVNYGVRSDFHAGQISPSTLIWRSIIKFDLTVLPANTYIYSAILSLYCYNRTAAVANTTGAFRALTQWFEGSQNGVAPSVGQDGSTWNLRNANGSVAWAGGAGGGAGSDRASTATATVATLNIDQWYDLDVTVDVRTFVAGTVTNYGWWIAATSTITNSRKFFYSSDEVTNSTLRPKLTITYASRLAVVLEGVGQGVMRGAR